MKAEIKLSENFASIVHLSDGVFARMRMSEHVAFKINTGLTFESGSIGSITIDREDITIDQEDITIDME